MTRLHFFLICTFDFIHKQITFNEGFLGSPKSSMLGVFLMKEKGARFIVFVTFFINIFVYICLFICLYLMLFPSSKLLGCLFVWASVCHAFQCVPKS